MGGCDHLFGGNGYAPLPLWEQVKNLQDENENLLEENRLLHKEIQELKEQLLPLQETIRKAVMAQGEDNDC